MTSSYSRMMLPSIVLLNSMPGLWFTRLRIVQRHNFLGRSRLAASVDASCIDWSKDSSSRPSWTTRHKAHDRSHLSSSRSRQDLIKHLWRPVEFDLRLHQLAIHVSDRCRRQRHLKWSHLSCIALSITHQRQIVTSDTFACNDRCFSRCQCAFDCVSTRVPNLWLLPSTQSFGWSVVGP